MKRDNLKRGNEIIEKLLAIEADIELFEDERSRIRGYVSGELINLKHRESQTNNYSFIPNDYIKAILLTALKSEQTKLEQELDLL